VRAWPAAAGPPLAAISTGPAVTDGGEAGQAATVMGLPEWTVLAILSQQATHGFAIAQLTTPHGELGRVWQVPRPVIYRAIRRLTEAKLIASQGTEPGHGPQRTIYAATPRGRDAARRWLDSPVSHIRDIRSELLLKLAVLHRRGEDAGTLIRRQRAVLAPIAAAIDAEAADGGFDVVLLAWRRSTAAAAIAFLDAIAGPLDAARKHPPAGPASGPPG
jgi:DNA-binding PadR family transcriptional regulator